MNRKIHPSEEDFDALCRAIVNAAQASPEEIHAAANAPFLYQRLCAQIAAEQKPIASIAPSQSLGLSFVTALQAFQNHWRWAFAAAVLAALVIAGGMRWRTTLAPQIATQQPALAPQTTTTSGAIAPVLNPAPLQLAHQTKATKAVRNKPLRVVATISQKVEEAEIATEFLPLTYSANGDDQRGQIVRLEMPRSVLATMGVPSTNVTGDRVKADVMLSDDGVALAIRFIQPQ